MALASLPLSVLCACAPSSSRPLVASPSPNIAASAQHPASLLSSGRSRVPGLALAPGWVVGAICGAPAGGERAYRPSSSCRHSSWEKGHREGSKAQGGAPRRHRSARTRRRGNARGQGARRVGCSAAGDGEPDEGASQVRSPQVPFLQAKSPRRSVETWRRRAGGTAHPR
ncbi:hypothetical protein BS78_01G372400 [Paspalum vaginatum]|nr:hypothetical protein BS78_01G372400 [Paspalum vaginatum]